MIGCHDVTGREITLGDYIVYPGRFDRSLYLNVGRVVDLDVRLGYGKGITPVLKIVGAHRHFSTGFTRHTKIQELTRINMAAVIPADRVPQAIKDVLA
jgi:hypothetical protein